MHLVKLCFVSFRLSKVTFPVLVCQFELATFQNSEKFALANRGHWGACQPHFAKSRADE